MDMQVNVLLFKGYGVYYASRILGVRPKVVSASNVTRMNKCKVFKIDGMAVRKCAVCYVTREVEYFEENAKKCNVCK